MRLYEQQSETNGDTKKAERYKLRLSDAFEVKELTTEATA